MLRRRREQHGALALTHFFLFAGCYTMGASIKLVSRSQSRARRGGSAVLGQGLGSEGQEHCLGHSCNCMAPSFLLAPGLVSLHGVAWGTGEGLGARQAGD